MLVKHIDEVPAKPVEMSGAKDVTVRVVFGRQDNAPNFAMRLFELSPGGYTPYHAHEFEHETLIMSGRIAIVTEAGERPLDVGEAVLVMAGEVHQFKNLSDDQQAKMICLVPVEYGG